MVNHGAVNQGFTVMNNVNKFALKTLATANKMLSVTWVSYISKQVVLHNLVPYLLWEHLSKMIWTEGGFMLLQQVCEKDLDTSNLYIEENESSRRFFRNRSRPCYRSKREAVGVCRERHLSCKYHYPCTVYLWGLGPTYTLMLHYSWTLAIGKIKFSSLVATGWQERIYSHTKPERANQMKLK